MKHSMFAWNYDVAQLGLRSVYFEFLMLQINWKSWNILFQIKVIINLYYLNKKPPSSEARKKGIMKEILHWGFWISKQSNWMPRLLAVVSKTLLFIIFFLKTQNLQEIVRLLLSKRSEDLAKVFSSLLHMPVRS